MEIPVRSAIDHGHPQGDRWRRGGRNWLQARLCAAYQAGELNRFQLEVAIAYLVPTIWDSMQQHAAYSPAAASFISVRVFYGTDRERSAGESKEWYGTAPSETVDLGMARVNIPRDRRLRPPGQLDRGGWRWLRIFRFGPKPDVILDTVMSLPPDAWADSLRKQITADTVPSLLVYVHGFNTTFKDAARRAAQLWWDLPFKGTAVMYSWPSLGSGTLGAYSADRRRMEKGVQHLKEFLELTVDRSQARSVHLLAHSMGCDLVARAVRELARTRPEIRFDQIILAAPDIDATLFTDSLGPPLDALAQGRVTMYASEHDNALLISQKVQSSPRVGRAGPRMVVLPWLDTIDASNVPDDFTGHGYYARTATMLNDIQAIVVNGIEPDRRRLDRLLRGTTPYWALLPPDR